MSQRERIIALFEEHRQAPGAPYDEEHFLDYLLANPKKKHAVYNSFSGLRRFNALIDQIQFENSICFSNKDREANYSLDKFVARVEELRSSPRSSMASLRNQMRFGYDVNVFIIANLLLAVPTIWFKSWLVAGILLSAALTLNGALVWFYRRGKQYNQRLQQRILEIKSGET